MSLLFLLGVNRSQWDYSLGLLNSVEDQCSMSKVWNESVTAVAAWGHYRIVFQSEPNFAWQIFVLARVCGSVFDYSFLNSRLHLINHFQMDTTGLDCAVSGARVNRCLQCLVTYGTLMWSVLLAQDIMFIAQRNKWSYSCSLLLPSAWNTPMWKQVLKLFQLGQPFWLSAAKHC